MLSAVVADVSRRGATPRTSNWGGWRSSGPGLQVRSSPTYGGKLVGICVTSGQGIVLRGMRRRPGDGDVVDLVQEDIDPSDETLVGHRFDGAGGKELDTMETRL